MNWISNIWKSKPKFVSADFVNPVFTDFHSHLIPGIDDGVQELEQSIQVLRGLSEMGYKKVITTPHIMGDFYKNGAHNILPGLELVRNELKAQNIPIELSAAAEYMVDDMLEQKIRDKSLLTLGDNYVLIELPFQSEPPNFKSILFELQLNGYKPILAHPERYGFMAMKKDRYEQLAQSGIYLQLNLFSLIGYYSSEVKATAEFLVKEKLIHFVGSDIHMPKHLPVMFDSIHSYLYQEICEQINLLNNTL